MIDHAERPGMGQRTTEERANDQRAKEQREKNRERRFGLGRRIRGDRRVVIVSSAVWQERRSGEERRIGSNRRTGGDRRRDRQLGSSR